MSKTLLTFPTFHDDKQLVLRHLEEKDGFSWNTLTEVNLVGFLNLSLDRKVYICNSTHFFVAPRNVRKQILPRGGIVWFNSKSVHLLILQAPHPGNDFCPQIATALKLTYFLPSEKVIAFGWLGHEFVREQHLFKTSTSTHCADDSTFKWNYGDSLRIQ